ncbi:hypothetical protein [Agromyces sp. NPDC056965]|uniref:hypothetical protein n=1 Tax=Agromyces sp. NPDC056965 TaxID=3345983 RepID=UPI003629609E
MDAITAPKDDRRIEWTRVHAGSIWRRTWPAALGVLVAAGTAYGLTDAREAASVVAASGLVYLAASATGRRFTAWIAFAASFVLITLDKFTGLDAVPWLFMLGAALVVVGLVSRRTRPWWAFPLQAVAMLLFGTIAYFALQLSPTIGGLLVAVALLGHAGWDISHHRTDRVVDHSFAQFCAVLDILVAVIVAVVALTS